MKLVLDLQLDRPEIPKDYRSGFMSLIKAAFEAGDELFYRHLYDTKTDKPFTFSVYFPGLTGEKNDHLIVGYRAILNFSTNDHRLAIYFYNGAIKLKSHQWKNDNIFSIRGIRALFNREIRNDFCVFRTVSPFLLNRKGDNLQYLTPDDEDFDNSFRFNIRELCNRFLKKPEVDFKYKILQHRKMVVSHYNQSMTCNKGILEIKASPEVLNLIYNIGIGVRRSQGFGMLEIV